MGLGERINAYAERKPRRFAIGALVIFMIPLLVAFVLWFLWAVTEFFQEQPSFDYYFWVALIVGGGGAFWMAAATLDLWRRQIVRRS